jgi:hypothetical protein
MSNTKQPNLGDLAIDHAGTRKIRSQLNKTKRIKITINIDERSLTFLGKVSRRSALPFLRLLDQALKEKGIEKGETKTRLDRIEKELKKWISRLLCGEPGQRYFCARTRRLHRGAAEAAEKRVFGLKNTPNSAYSVSLW